MTGFVDESIARLTSAGLVAASQLSGCTEQDIAKIEAKYGIQLPAAYRSFLAAMGRSAGTFFVGTDFLFPDVLTLREQAERLLQECKAKIALGKTDFVFAVHQGYQFLFMKSGESDDPAVFLYEECEEDFRLAADRFSDWLLACVEDEIAAAKAVKPG